MGLFKKSAKKEPNREVANPAAASTQSAAEAGVPSAAEKKAAKRPVKIAVCCGGGIFTTSVVTEEVESLLRREGVPYQITPQKITEIPSLTGVDIIIATGKTKAANAEGAPVLIGLPMFTGVGKEEFSQLLLRTIDQVL